MNKEKIVSLIKKERKKRGLSVYKMQKLTGLTAYKAVETNRNPTLESLVKIFEALGMEIIIKNKNNNHEGVI